MSPRQRSSKSLRTQEQPHTDNDLEQWLTEARGQGRKSERVKEGYVNQDPRPRTDQALDRQPGAEKREPKDSEAFRVGRPPGPDLVGREDRSGHL